MTIIRVGHTSWAAKDGRGKTWAQITAASDGWKITLDSGREVSKKGGVYPPKKLASQLAIKEIENVECR